MQVREIHPGYEIQGRRQQKSKTGVSVTPQKGPVSSKFFLKNLKTEVVWQERSTIPIGDSQCVPTNLNFEPRQKFQSAFLLSITHCMWKNIWPSVTFCLSTFIAIKDTCMKYNIISFHIDYIQYKLYFNLSPHRRHLTRFLDVEAGSPSCVGNCERIRTVGFLQCPFFVRFIAEFSKKVKKCLDFNSFELFPLNFSFLYFYERKHTFNVGT